MKTRIAVHWSNLQSRYWFYPGLLAGAAIALALVMNRLDAALFRDSWHLDWVSPSTPEGARAVLTTIAGATITVAGVVFSITMVVLNTASQQFGPRLLHNFMRHNGTQVVLGTFIATTVYCLIVLTDLGGGEQAVSLPHLALFVGMLLAFLSFAMLVYFFHHVTRFVRAPMIIEEVASRLAHRLRVEFPERPLQAPRRSVEGAPVQTLCATGSGYVEAVDIEHLVEVARDLGVALHVLRRAGQFVVAGSPLVEVTGQELDDSAARRVHAGIMLGPERTDDQDPEFSISQLAEIALRALSPALNDPFTANTCIDRLGAMLALVADRCTAPELRCDDAGCARVRIAPFTKAHLVHAAFDHLRRSASGHPAVARRILETIAELGRRPLERELRDALRAQVEALEEASHEMATRRDREAFDLRHREALAALAA